MKNSDNFNTISKTPQELVHIKHTISARQYKYWFLLLKIYKEQLENGLQADKNGFYHVSLAEIYAFLGYEPVKKEFKSDLEKLRKEPIIINYLGKDNKPVTHGMGFISEWKVSSTKIAFKFPSFIEDVMKGDLEAKQMFLLLNWEIFNSLNGKYEAIIYKLCKDYIGIGRTPYFTVDEYRDYIGLSENEYKIFKELNRWTISNPIKNINNNEMVDILVDVVLEKMGRKVVGLYFIAKYKNNNNQELKFENHEPNPVFQFAKTMITPKQQMEYLTQYLPEQIEAIIERANEYITDLKKNGKKANIGAIYKKAFTENWGEQKLFEKQEIERKKEAKKQAEKQKIEIEKVREQKIAEDKENTKRAIEIFDMMGDSEKEAVLNEVENKLAPFFQERFRKNRANNVPVYNDVVVAVILKKIILNE